MSLYLPKYTGKVLNLPNSFFNQSTIKERRDLMPKDLEGSITGVVDTAATIPTKPAKQTEQNRRERHLTK